jgi:hypothetical protein
MVIVLLVIMLHVSSHNWKQIITSCKCLNDQGTAIHRFYTWMNSLCGYHKSLQCHTLWIVKSVLLNVCVSQFSKVKSRSQEVCDCSGDSRGTIWVPAIPAPKCFHLPNSMAPFSLHSNIPFHCHVPSLIVTLSSLFWGPLWLYCFHSDNSGYFPHLRLHTHHIC